MATVNHVVLGHHGKADKTYNVKIRITKGGTSAYIDTSHYVTVKQLKKHKKGWALKDQFIIDQLNPVLADYRKMISSWNGRDKIMDAQEIKEALLASEKEGQEVRINFGEFCKRHIKNLRESGQSKYAGSLQTVYFSLCDYFGHDGFLITEINSNMLRSFEAYLKTERVIVRTNQFGREVKTVSKPVGNGLHNYMRDLRVLFNDCCDEFNNEDIGLIVIKHYPFKKYKVGSAPATEKRGRPVEQIKAVRDVEVITPEEHRKHQKWVKEQLVVDPKFKDSRKYIVEGSRAEFARDMAMLSFYLCGTNAKDFYVMDEYGLERIEYNRSKTKGKRKDKAFISMSAPDVAIPLLKKYIGILSLRFSTQDNLNKALSIGLREVGRVLEIPNLEFYDFRHSFGDLARNVCRFQKEDVALAMNHVDQNFKTTDIYISKDWKIVDEVQSGVLGLLK